MMIHLEKNSDILKPEWAVGVGAFAESKISTVSEKLSFPMNVTRVLHPSPASPGGEPGLERDCSETIERVGYLELSFLFFLECELPACNDCIIAIHTDSVRVLIERKDSFNCESVPLECTFLELPVQANSTPSRKSPP